MRAQVSRTLVDGSLFLHEPGGVYASSTSGNTISEDYIEIICISVNVPSEKLSLTPRLSKYAANAERASVGLH